MRVWNSMWASKLWQICFWFFWGENYPIWWRSTDFY